MNFLELSCWLLFLWSSIAVVSGLGEMIVGGERARMLVRGVGMKDGRRSGWMRVVL